VILFKYLGGGFNPPEKYEATGDHHAMYDCMDIYDGRK
jgi:hypothetical protein